MVDLILENDRAKTVDKLPSSALSWYRAALEGRKTFKGEHLSFEATGSNLEKWKERFPNSKIIDESSLSVFEEQDRPNDRPEFVFKTKPYAHQVRAFEKLKDLTNASLLMQMGTGKSKSLSDLIGYKWSKGQIDAAIILSPKGVHNQWVEEQLPTHMAVPYVGWAWEKGKKAEAELATVRQSSDLQVLTFNIDAIKTDSAFNLIVQFIRQHNGRVFMAIDEAHLCKNPSALRTKKAYQLGSMCDFRAILTGSPIVKNIADIFGEYRFLDGRIIGAKYFTTFRNEYCETRNNGFGLEIIGAKNLEKLYGKIDPVTFRATKDELDLPSKMYDEYAFDLSDEQKKRYKEIKTQFMTATTDDKFLTVTNAASALVRLQQISCGYLPTEEGGFIELPNPRLEALLNVLEQNPGKAIIWARFTKDIESIHKALSKRSVTYYGATSPTDREQAVKRFLSPDSGIDYFIGNPAAAGVGLNLQGECTTAIYYSQSFNAVERFQSEDRIHRIGTKGTCTYIDLIARGTVDKKIASNLKAKKSLSDLAIDEIRLLFE
jgi:SNF2 family DNA or RNA helicase